MCTLLSYNAASFYNGTFIAQNNQVSYSNMEMAKIFSKAIYKDSKTEDIVNKKLKKYKKQLPKSIISTIKYTYPITQILVYKNIQYKWEF